MPPPLPARRPRKARSGETRATFMPESGKTGHPRTRYEEVGMAPSYLGNAPAPDFAPGLDWLNTERPLSLADVRGKLVVLDFWTFC